MAALALSLAACSLAPRYEQPALPVPAQFPGQQAEAAQSVAWKTFFRDPRLAALIELALENNRDLRIALSRSEEAQAQYGLARSERFPTIGPGGTAQIARTPESLRAAGTPSVSRQYQAGVSLMSFELDFFGRVRNLSEAAFQQYLATDQARRTVQLTLVAQVAEAYFRLRTAEQLEQLTRSTMNTRQATFKLVQSRYDAGVASELDLHQARSQLDALRADQQAVLRQRVQAGNALQLLLGATPPENLPEPAAFDRNQLLAALPSGQPSDLLTRRPDIIAAEHTLRAANANIGAARAAFFPNISLTGLLGFASPQLAGLFSSDNRMWQFSPQIFVPLFSRSTTANLDVAQARQHIAVAQYEKAIQVAFREVADALAGEATYAPQLDALRDRERAAMDSLRLARLRYETGVDSFLQVQTAEEALYGVQQQLLQLGMDSLLNRVGLYKALGGDWQAWSAEGEAERGATEAGNG